MLRDLDQSSLSELESEYELEMDDMEFEYEEEARDEEYEGDFEYESGDEEYENDFEYEGDDEYEMSDSENSDYSERFYELAQMEFESESELDQEVNGILNEMEQDFFFKTARKFWKSRGRGLLGKLGKFALSKLPHAQALKSLTQLARGDLKGSLLGLAKTALSSHPAIAAAMPALDALGFGKSGNSATDSTEENKEAWDNYVEVAREAYENLAKNLNENITDPMVANEVAKKSLKTALNTVKAGTASGRMQTSGSMPGTAIRQRGRKRVVYLRPGEYLVVIRKRR